MKFSYTLQTSAPPEKVWAIWTDVANWSEWDTELSESSLDGAFGLGVVGKLKPKSGPVSPFRISQFDAEKSYTLTMKLPLSKLSVYRHLHVRSDKTYFTHEVSFHGFLALLFGVLLGQRFRMKLPGIMENIKRIAEVKN